MAPLQPNNKKAKLQARGAQDDLKERREVRELDGLRAEIKQLEADLVAAQSANDKKESGGASGKEELKQLQKELKIEKRQRIQLEEEAAARSATVLVAPTPSPVKTTDSDGVEAELKQAKARIVLLKAEIEALKEESGTYRVRLNQVERELKSASEKTKCKKCEINDSKVPPVTALDEADWAEAECALKDRIAALEKERATSVEDRAAGQKREVALKAKNDTLSKKANASAQAKELAEQEELVTMYEMEIEEVREFLDSVSGKRCCSHHAVDESLMEKVTEVWSQHETMKEHVDNCAESKASVEELTTKNATQLASLRKANEKVSKSDLRIRQLEMKVSETQKLVDDARRGVAGKAPVLPAAPIVVATPITPPASPPTTNSDVPAVPTIALAKYRELEQMHAAVNIALRNEKDKAKKTELAASKSNSKAFVTNNEVAVLESEIKRLKAVPPTIVVEERIVEKVVVAERIVEKIVIKVVDRPVERAANGSEITPSAGTPPSVVEARLREAITKMAATVSVLQGAIATLRDENTALLLESIGV